MDLFWIDVQSALESRVKAEQQQTEGVAGVLAAMKEQGHNAGKMFYLWIKTKYDLVVLRKTSKSRAIFVGILTQGKKYCGLPVKYTR